MAEKLLEIRDLFVEYDTDDGVVKALNGINLVLEKGETLGLVGETGAGKTTLAKSVLQILPEPPAKITGGEIYFEGQNVLKLSNREKRKIRGNKISMIFQDPMSALNPVEKVGNQIAEGLILHQKLSKVEAAKKAGDMMEMVGIPRQRYGEFPHQFSGGMKQRVIIAIALACRPQLLLADEATTALDVTIQAQVLELIDNLKKQLQTSVIMITHDLGVVAQTCDRVAVVYAGNIMEYGTKRQIFKSGPEKNHPYTTGLFGSLPNMEKKERRLHAIPGLMPNPMDLPPGCPFHPRCPRATEACKGGEIPVVEVEEGHLIRCCQMGQSSGAAEGHEPHGDQKEGGRA